MCYRCVTREENVLPMTMEKVINDVSRQLYILFRPYFGKTKTMTDDDWEKLIQGVNDIHRQSEGSGAKKYAGEYGMCLLNELERERKAERNV